MPHQQRPAAAGAEAAEVAAARQQLPPGGAPRQLAQAQALQFGHHQPTALRQQLHRAGGLQGQPLLAAAPRPEAGGGAAQGAAAPLGQQVAAAVAAQVGEQQRLRQQRPQGSGFGIHAGGRPLPRWSQGALPQGEQPQPISRHQGHPGAIPQGAQGGDALEHRRQRQPAPIAALQLQLFAVAHRCDHQQPGPGIPEPALGGERQAAAVPAAQQHLDGAHDRLLALQQQPQGVAFPQPLVGHAGIQLALGRQAGAGHRAAEQQIQGGRARTGGARAQLQHPWRPAQQQLLLQQRQGQAAPQQQHPAPGHGSRGLAGRGIGRRRSTSTTLRGLPLWRSTPMRPSRASH